MDSNKKQISTISLLVEEFIIHWVKLVMPSLRMFMDLSGIKNVPIVIGTRSFVCRMVLDTSNQFSVANWFST